MRVRLLKPGTTNQALSRYERGERSPMLSAAVHFSEVLGVSIEEMCGMDPPKQPSVPEMLTPEESALITTFRSLSSEGQRLMLATAQSFATNPAYQNNIDDQAI